MRTLTSSGEIVADGTVRGIPAGHKGKPGNEEAQGKGCQVQGQDDHVQEVPPVQEVASQALDPHLLTLKPQEAWGTGRGQDRVGQSFLSLLGQRRIMGREDLLVGSGS